jgi:hypothetical protein
MKGFKLPFVLSLLALSSLLIATTTHSENTARHSYGNDMLYPPSKNQGETINVIQIDKEIIKGNSEVYLQIDQKISSTQKIKLNFTGKKISKIEDAKGVQYKLVPIEPRKVKNRSHS